MKGFFTGMGMNVVLLGFVSLMTDLSSQMVFPLIPLFLTSVLGAGASIVGMIEGAAETTASLLKVFSGYYSDKIKKRKPFIVFGYALSALIKPLFALATAWPVVLGIRIIERIGKGLRNAPRDALVAESTDISVRGKAYGFHRAMDGLGSLGGALLALVLLPVLGYRMLFAVSVIPGLLAITFLAFVKEKTPEGTEGKVRPKLEAGFTALPKPLTRYILLVSVFAFGHFGYAFLLLRAKNVGLQDTQTIGMYVIFYLVYMIVSTPSGIVSDKIGRKPVLAAGYLLFVFISLLLSVASTLPVIVLSFALYGVFYAMIDGVQRAFAVDLSPPQLKATTLGIFHMAIGIVALPGGYVAGLLWDTLGPPATFLFGIITALTAAALLYTVPRPQNP